MKKIISLFSVLFFTSFLYAEIVTMKDGTVYNGNIHLDDGQKVYLIQDTEFIELNKADIKEINNEEEKKREKIFGTDEVLEEKKLHEVIFKLGFEFYGEYYDKKVSKDNDSLTGVNFSAEYFFYVKNTLGIGIGTNMSDSKSIGNVPGKFYFMPVYMGLKLRSEPTVPYKYGYVTAYLGYNMLFIDSQFDNAMVDETGGIYYGAAVGIVYNSFVVEISASSSSAKAGYKGLQSDIDMKYYKYCLSVGYIFDF